MYAIYGCNQGANIFLIPIDAWSQIIPCRCNARPVTETSLRSARVTASSDQALIPFVGWEEMLRNNLVPDGAQLVFPASSSLP